MKDEWNMNDKCQDMYFLSFKYQWILGIKEEMKDEWNMNDKCQDMYLQPSICKNTIFLICEFLPRINDS